MKNYNHPLKGSSITVDPIRDPKDIQRIKKLLSDKPRDLAIFILGINTNLRASDIVKLTVGQVRHLKEGDHFRLKEQKTGKGRCVSVGPKVLQALQDVLATIPEAQDHEPIFQSRKGGGPLTVPYINHLVKSWCAHFRIPGNFGSHTLRKTFGYQHRVANNRSIPVLMKMFNRSTQQQTLAYLGIQDEEIKAVYMQEI